MARFPVMAQLLLWLFFVLPGATLWSAEEPVVTPSAQMKEAVNKLARTPATIRKSLGDLTDSAKEKLRQTLGRSVDADTATEPVDLELPKKLSRQPAPRNTRQMNRERDPFRPMTLRTRLPNRPRENLSPLERLELSQIKLVGIVWDIGEPRAIVEDSAGLGYTIKVGTPIGTSDGRVKAIHRNEVIIEESFVDISGAQRKHDVSLKFGSQ